MSNYESGEYNFSKDLNKGRRGEDVIASVLQSHGFRVIGDCNNSSFDLIMEYNRKPYTYEIKTDLYCNPENDTGNIAVEVESRGKASGISVTQADYFVTYFPNLGEIWNIKTEDLKSLIERNNIYLKENGGDKGSNTKFYLVNKNKFRNYFKVYKI